MSGLGTAVTSLNNGLAILVFGFCIALSTSAFSQESLTSSCGEHIGAKVGESERQSAINALRRIARVDSSTAGDPFHPARTHADCVSRVYQLGAGRHQQVIDLGSGAVVFNAAGSLLSGSSSAAQTNFGYAAFVPIVATQLLANEPSRDLYVGGTLALDRITARYVELHVARDELSLQVSESAAACQASGKLWRDISALATNEARTTMLADARKFLELCEAMRRFDGEFAIFEEQFRRVERSLGRDYADDVVKLNDLLYQRHRDVRSNPSETLTTILAAPFRAADRILTGSDGQAAIDRLKTQNAFQGLGYSLHTYVLTRPTTTLSDPIGLSDASRRLTPDDAAADLFRQLMSLEGALATMRSRRLSNLAYVDYVIALSNANAVMVEYDGVSRLITVRIEPPRQVTVLPPATTSPTA